jgi:hypothetical protein
MRPRLIQSVPGLDPNGSPFERFRRFAGVIAKVRKVKADKEMKKVERPTRRRKVIKNASDR